MRRLRPTTVYYGIELLMAMPNFAFLAVYLVRDLHFSPLELILMGTVMEATIFVMEIPTGVVADTYSRRASIILSLVLQGVAWGGVAFVQEPVLVIALWGLWGLGWTFMSGAYEAWITDEVGPDKVGPVFLKGSRMGYIGGAIGLAIGTAIAVYSVRAAVVFGGATLVAAGILALVSMPQTGFGRAPREERGRAREELVATARAGAKYVRLQPLLLLILAITFFAGMSTEAFDRLTEAHFIRDVGLPAIGSLDPVVWFGIFGAIGIPLGYFANTVLARRFKDGAQPRLARTLIVLTAAMMVAQFAFAFATLLGVALVAMFAYRVARGLMYPVYMTWLNQQITDSSVRATVISITGQSDAIGQVAGGPALGVVGNVWGIRAALAAGAAVLAPALGLYGRALAHDGREPELERLPAPAEV